jgi:transcription initiation factor TFIIE subunit alpha
LIAENWEDHLIELEEKLDHESNYVFFECPDECEEKLPFEIAAEYDFKCSVCGKELKHVDNKSVIKETIKEIKELKTQMKKIDAK